MGTTFSIKIIKNNFLLLGDYQGKVKSIEDDIKKILEKVNDQMSTYRKNSEISRFNDSTKISWFKVSRDTARVVKTSIEISRKSGGKFDITVGPLVNLWGFGKDFSDHKVPQKKDIEELKKNIGFRNLEVNLSPPSLRKKKPGIYCDLSAIAKGFGVDKVAEYLDKTGFYNYLVEIGGEIRVRGKNGKDQLWRLGIQSPGDESGISKIISISDSSMATSGDYHNYFEKNGIRYSHTIDPSTGYPIKHKLVSVTVIQNTCMMADAFATAIDVMGPDIGLKFAFKENIPVFLIKKEGNKFVEIMTPSFKKILNN